MPANNKTFKAVISLATKFVEQKKGSWNHADWEDLLGQVGKAGVPVTDEVKIKLGSLLETSKFFFALEPAEAPKASKARPKSKK